MSKNNLNEPEVEESYLKRVWCKLVDAILGLPKGTKEVFQMLAWFEVKAEKLFQAGHKKEVEYLKGFAKEVEQKSKFIIGKYGKDSQEFVNYVVEVRGHLTRVKAEWVRLLGSSM